MARRSAGTRRARSPHPGVVILQRERTDSPTVTHRARWTDPDTGKVRFQTLETLGLTTHEARRAWAVAKSRAIQKRAAELASGAPRATNTTVEGAVAGFLERCAAELRPGTVACYRSSIAKLATWASRAGLVKVEDLTRAHLAAFRVQLAKMPSQRPARDARRGAKRDTAKTSPATRNSDLRACKAMLNDWRRLGLLPKLDSDAIGDGLKPFAVERPRPIYFKSPELRAILEAALAHDAETFTATRAEHRGAGRPGSTPRYRPIAPLTLAAMLTGCRLGELLSLPWEAVDLEGASDLILSASATKTRSERAVGLDCAPALRSLLEAMRARAGEDAFVFGGAAPMPFDEAKAAGKRLRLTYGAPRRFTWKALRSNCSTYLVNASVYGTASPWLAAKRSGHSVAVMERHYAGLLRLPESKTLEAVMKVEDIAERIVEAERARAPRLVTSAG